MRSWAFLRLWPLLSIAALEAQTGPGPSADAKLFSDIAAQSARMQGLIQQIKPREWLSAGAPDRYIALSDELSKENQSILIQAQATVRAPEQLAGSLKLLESVRNVQESLSDLLEGVAKYQNPALAELISGIQVEGRPLRDAYSHHVVDLALERDQQFQVVDHEAQRCRELLSKDPAAARRALKSK